MSDKEEGFVPAPNNSAQNRKYKDREERQAHEYKTQLESFSLKDKGLDQGMIREGRQCTDIFCLGLFVVFLAAMGYATNFGLENGNIQKLLAPIDGAGKFCGVTPGYEKHKYLYMRNLIGNPVEVFLDAVCVEECPEIASATVSCMSLDATAIAKGKAYCIPKTAADQTAPYDSKDVFGLCLPKSYSALPQKTKDAFAAVKATLKQGKSGQFFNDLWNSSRAIYASMAMASVYCLIFIYLMSAFAEPIAWACIFLVQISLFVVSFASYYFYNEANDQLEGLDPKSRRYEAHAKESAFMLGLCLVFGILACAFLCCVFCGRRHLKLAIDVIDASADFIAGNKRVIMVPIIYFILTITAFCVWLPAMLCVVSLNKITVGEIQLVPQDRSLEWEDKYIYLALFMLFGLLWIIAFFDYSARFVILASASSYYFSSSPTEEGTASLMYAFKIAHINHTGSIIFGSFAIAVVKFIKLIFLYFAEKAREAQGTNPAIRCIICCGTCCLQCIEKIVDYINEAGLAYIAVTGDNFCNGAWNGFLLNLKHMLKFTFANMIAKAFIFLGKVGITVGNCLSLLFIMEHITHDMDQINSVWGPVLVVGSISFITASLFLAMFDTTVMAMMTSLAVDMDLNGDAPRFGPPTFHAVLENVESSKDNRVSDDYKPAGNEIV